LWLSWTIPITKFVTFNHIVATHRGARRLLAVSATTETCITIFLGIGAQDLTITVFIASNVVVRSKKQ